MSYEINLDNFNWLEYIELNEDLKHLNSESHAKYHYETQGYFENRKYCYKNIPFDFNWKEYIELNEDLKHLNSESHAKYHYETQGYSENRKYCYKRIPPDFNWKEYIELNEDLKHLNSESHAKYHYAIQGYSENRKYCYKNIPFDFNWQEYILIHKDLNHLNSESEAKYHYAVQGYLEEREYSFINLTNENKNIINMPYINIKLDKTITDVDYKYNINSCMSETELLKTKLFYKNNVNFLKHKIDQSSVNFINNFILVVDFFNGGGGTTYFLNQIVSKYKYHQTFIIARSYKENEIQLNINEEYDITNTYNVEQFNEFLITYQKNILKVFVNHTHLYTQPLLDCIFDLKKYDKQIIGITHDYSLLFEKCQPYYYEIFNNSGTELTPSYIDCNNYDLIITQNKINLLVLNKYFKKKIDVVPLPDFTKSKSKITTYNTNIVVGIIGNIIDIKGRRVLEKIINNYKITHQDKIKFVVFGHTNINSFENYYYYNSIEELNNLLITHSPNMLLELSIWPETYSYTLTMYMLTNLPIIYLNKRFNSVIHNRLLNYTNAYGFNTLKELHEIIFRVKQDYFYTINDNIYYNEYWDNLFITNKSKANIKINDKFKYNVKPYMIYFPQFHKIKENDINFYTGYTDIQNLFLLNTSKKITQKFIESPSTQELNISSVKNYDLTNTDIIKKQIEIISHYNISGFAMYYYWFTTNTITNENMIMNKVIDSFFNNNISLNGKKIFFIWANENWSDNKAFGDSEENQIENVYDKQSFKKNSLHLMKYFKHNNYLKINNKPVFFIYHPWILTENQLSLFKNILNEECKKNKFNGIHFVLNNINSKYPNEKSFYINFNYKKSDCRYYDENKKQIYLDYKNYLNNSLHFSKNIQTICFNFDNRARLTLPNNLNNSTICIENTEVDKIFFMNKILNLYKENEDEETIDNILLINAFNEWGEKMIFEPSNEYEYYNLNLLTDYLKN